MSFYKGFVLFISSAYPKRAAAGKTTCLLKNVNISKLNIVTESTISKARYRTHDKFTILEVSPVPSTNYHPNVSWPSGRSVVWGGLATVASRLLLRGLLNPWRPAPCGVRWRWLCGARGGDLRQSNFPRLASPLGNNQVLFL